MEETIFRKEELEDAKAPDPLDKYIKSTGTGIWFLLTAILCLFLSAGIWSVTGTLPETIDVDGYTYTEREVYCFLPIGETTDIEGCAVKAVCADGTIVNGKVEQVGEIPLSKRELAEKIDFDWLADNILAEEYSYEVIISLEEVVKENILTTVTITVNEIKPIEFILN